MVNIDENDEAAVQKEINQIIEPVIGTHYSIPIYTVPNYAYLQNTTVSLLCCSECICQLLCHTVCDFSCLLFIS